ncbi:MAG TPA: hypothetical protein VEP66_05465 [Myxococcales bacterium]|nr:hypothetical protein [Myxococcales bacterium]
MVSLNVAATWTRMLSVTAGACASAGAPGPGTRVRGKPALEWIAGPWLGLIDFDGLERAEREALHAWLFGQAEPLLLVRNLLMAKPLGEEIFIELTEQAIEAMPQGWRDAARPILILVPAGRGRPERRREYLDALSRLRIPLVSRGSELWAVREFDASFLVAIAQLQQPADRAAFRAAMEPAQTYLFDQQLAVAEAAVLDDLVGGRDEESALALDLDALSSLHPQVHPLALYAAVERAHNRRRDPQERTQFSGRTTEARLSARAFPEAQRSCTDEFARRAAALEPLLPGDLQRIFEASELLAQP